MKWKGFKMFLTVAKTVQNNYKQICGGSWCKKTKGNVLFHWSKCYYGLWTGILAIINGLKLKHLTDGLVSYKQAVFHFTRCQLLFVDYCDDFIICLISYSDGTHSLQRIQWWMSDVVLNFSNRFQWKNKRIYILDGLSVSTFSELHIFGGGGGDSFNV